jgi:hypothetical protein
MPLLALVFFVNLLARVQLAIIERVGGEEGDGKEKESSRRFLSGKLKRKGLRRKTR